MHIVMAIPLPNNVQISSHAGICDKIFLGQPDVKKQSL